MGGGRQDDGGAIPVEDAFSWMFRPPVTPEQTDAWFQPPAQPSELPTPPEPPESYQSPAVRYLLNDVRQGIVPDEALAEIKRDPTSLRSIMAIGEGALGVGTLLAGGEKLELPRMPMGEAAPKLPAGEGFVWGAKPIDQIQGLPKSGVMPESRFAKAGSESGQFSGDELALMKQVVPDAFTQGGVDVPKLHEGLAQSGPVVEVKKLGAVESTPGTQRMAEIRHELDTRFPNWGDRQQNPRIFARSGDEVTLVDELNDLTNAHLDRIQSGSGTGNTAQYAFVGPKPENQMPGYVEGLVRLPIATTKGPREVFNSQGESLGRPEYIGPHFGTHDKNVLSSYRGYEEALPNGEKAFHVIEVQSDWGQNQRQAQERIAQYHADPESTDLPPGTHRASVTGHPLLQHYETLGLKAAIQHAKEIGATKVILPDAETAMMTEGHDRAAVIPHEEENFGFDAPGETTAQAAASKLAKEKGVTPVQDPRGNWSVRWQTGPAEVDQAGGMRLHYDQTLPSAMRKLTGDKGTPVDLGTHKGAIKAYGNTVDVLPGESPAQAEARARAALPVEGSPVFKDAAGKPKTNITGKIYDISKTPDQFKLMKAGDKFSAAKYLPA